MKLILGFLVLLCCPQLSPTQDTEALTYGDLIFLVDSSDSMGEKVFNQLKSFLSKTISLLQIGVDQYQIGLVQYNEDIKVGFSLSTFKAKNPMMNYIKNKFQFQGGSLKTGNALSKVHEMFLNGNNGREKSKYPQVLVVITSGSSIDNVNPSAIVLKQDDIKIITIGVNKASSDDLKGIATSPDLAFKIDNLRNLSSFSGDMVTYIGKAIKKRHAQSTQDIPPADVMNNGIATNMTSQTNYSCGQAVAIDVVLMVDVSEHSLLESKDLNNFLKNVTLSLKISNYCNHLGIVVYDSKARVIASLDKGVNYSLVEQIIEKIQPSKEAIANIGQAIHFTRTQAFGDIKTNRKTQGIQQVAILVTHRSSADNISEEANLLQKEMKVFTMGIAQANETQMSQIASQPTDRYKVIVKTFSDLSGQADILQKKILNAVHLVNFVQPEKTVHTKKGCLSSEQADIHILMDGSGSIYPDEFTDMKTFLVSLMDMFDTGPQKVRVGAIQYADRNQLEFGIGTEYSKSDLKLALQNIRQIGGGTNTGAAINFTHELIVDPRNGRAQKVPVYLIVLTDGESQDSVKEAAEILRGEDVIVYAIGVKEANETQLLEITGDGKRVHYVYSFASLKDIKDVIAQQICAVQACEEPVADVMFLVDSSGSIGIDNFNKMKTFMKSLVNQTKVGQDLVQFGVVQFSDTSMEVLQLNRKNDKEAIWNAIDKMNYMAETTYTGEALKFVADYFTEGKGARRRVKKILILITDGEAHDEVNTPAASLRSSGVTIISVGVFNANKAQLFEISGKMERVHYLESFDTLKTIEDELVFGICSPEEECTRVEVADIVFVIDSSGSISDQQYNIMKNFIIAIVSKSDVGPNKVQFGALKYSDDPEKIFYLNQHSNKQDIIDAIQNDKKIDGSTYTAKALEFSKAFFTEKHGSRERSDVPQYLIIITDGESHDHDKLSEASKALQDAGVILFSVGVDKAKTEELEIMAGTKGKWFFVENFDGLNDVLADVTNAVCNKTECLMEEADLVFLIDGSTSISPSNFEDMKNFIVTVVDDFNIGPGRVHVGIAQYSHLYRPEFLLNDYTDKETIKDKVANISKIEGNTHIGKALNLTASELFSLSTSSRINKGVPQILVVITDGESQDDVVIPAQAVRSKGIETLAVGVGQVSETQLLEIAGSPLSRYSIANFTELKSIKERVVRDICTHGPHDCLIDVVVAFDISTYPNGAKLFYGQNHLEKHLDDILNRMANVRSASCSHGVKPGISVAFYVPNVKIEVAPLFRIYSPDLVHTLKTSHVTGPLYLNSTTLEYMWKIFHNQDMGNAKILLVFTDGLDEDVEQLENTMENLRKLGLGGLVTVALEGTKHYDELKYIEFGRGFEYQHQMYIGMPNIDFKLSKQMTRVAETTCCCVQCMCFAERGSSGERGVLGKQGPTGPKGAQGHAGEEGGEGKRGLPGPKGEPGDTGFPGPKGRKGKRGIPGSKNEEGDPGLDGIPGEQGKHGRPGSHGEKGERGTFGNPGIRGFPGDKGSKGISGDMGDPGMPSTIPGPAGLKGQPGAEGESDQPGSPGAPGDTGSGDIPGRRGAVGPPGINGDPGEPGPEGDKGVEGLQGEEGSKGSKGEEGSQGPNGLPGAFGDNGVTGNRGRPGATGKKREPGDPGEKGSPGPDGQNGLMGEDGAPGFGEPGTKGEKGLPGFPGKSGYMGEPGDPGVEGEQGQTGMPGGIIPGNVGEVGDAGHTGPPGRRGNKGAQGHTPQSPCDLISVIRNTCPCCQGKSTCPVYPTEMVFALDMSKGITPAIYTKMIDIVTSLLSNIKIREGKCPVGARVAVVSYNKYTKYLLRFAEGQSHEQLLTAVKNISLEKSTNGHDIGSSMRFVARNIFKRSLQGATVRKIAVFFNNGPPDDVVSINTAVMEFNALGIIPAVISFSPVPAIKKAFSIDDTGTFQLINIPPNGDYKPLIQTLETCTLCFDPCKPDPQCVAPSLPRTPLDMVFLLDSSYNMKQDDFQAAKGFISSMVDKLNVSNAGDRVALVSNTPPGFILNGDRSPHVEFDLLQYDNSLLIIKHLQENCSHLQGPPAVGFTLQWTLENLMNKNSNSRKHKAIILILSGETSLWDKQVLSRTSLNAKCQGYPLFVLYIGKAYNHTELVDLASFPTEHHLLQLGIIHKPEFGYALGFVHSFLNSIRRSINKYPHPELKAKCNASGNSLKKRQL